LIPDSESFLEFGDLFPALTETRLGRACSFRERFVPEGRTVVTHWKR
jgi:hypothetical protein